MKNQVLVKRYAQGFVNSVKDDTEFKTLYSRLFDFKKLLSEQKDLTEIFRSPFLPTIKKKEILKEVLAKIQPESKATRFLLLLVENERLELFNDLFDFLPDIWNEEKGISTFEVSSVVPLSDIQKKKLAEKLEHLEKRRVVLKYKKDPSLIGGISLRKGNMVYDVSLEGSLQKLKEKISEG